MEEEKLRRIKQLEEKAKERYIGMTEWKHVIETLSEDEQKEYRELIEEERKEDQEEEQKYELINKLTKLAKNLDDTSRLDFIDETVGLEYVEDNMAEALREMDIESLEELFDKYKDKV